MKRACLEFCISLLDDINDYSDFHSVLLSGLAALDINPASARYKWRGPSEYTQLLSAVVKLARIIIVKYGFQ